MKVPTLFTIIERVCSEFGAPAGVADRLGYELDDACAEWVADQLRQHCDADEPHPRRLGCTELEASLRWCPFAREVVSLGKKDAGIGNRYLDRDGSDFANPAGCRCIGSLCMTWRWLDALRGCCGLAGEPRFQPVGDPRRLPSRTPLERPSESLARDLELIDDDE